MVVGSISLKIIRETDLILVVPQKIIAVYLGDNLTNNYAEYMALIFGLAAIPTLNNKISIYRDSNMILNILQKMKIISRYAKQQEFLYNLYQFQNFQMVIHNFREKNTAADKLANLAMDQQKLKLEDKELVKPIEGNLMQDLTKELGKNGDNIKFDWRECQCITEVTTLLTNKDIAWLETEEV